MADEDDFDAAFAEVALAAEKTPDPALDPPAEPAPAPEPVVAAPAPAPAPEPSAAPAPVPVTAAPAPIPAPAPAVVAPAAAAPAPTPTPAPAPAAAPAPEPVETPEAKATREAFEASIKPYEPSDAEKAALAKFKEDFPNEYEAVEARLKTVDRDINARVYAAVQGVLKHVDPRLTSVEATTVTGAAERHFATLRTAHADYDVVIPKIPEWIKTQPSYLQPALQSVYDSGSTQDVLALVADYKKTASATPTPVPIPVPAPKPSGVDDLTPVGTRRATPVPKGAPDPNDFDGAWAELAAASK